MTANNNKGTDHHTVISHTECIQPRQKCHHSTISASLFANRIVYGTVILLLLVAPLGKSILNIISFRGFYKIVRQNISIKFVFIFNE